eukprot:NODE_8696_length_371_cov_242.313291.p3 GENE.NODE_8696_length_371_cov_242.313291~~NODE_8696_length_371_cov_242.313291.p3  ORF type:complete len:54 (+),score=6.52 NODE_8696_length_371_cov_242.313291:63-224(+)
MTYGAPQADAAAPKPKGAPAAANTPSSERLLGDADGCRIHKQHEADWDAALIR